MSTTALDYEEEFVMCYLYSLYAVNQMIYVTHMIIRQLAGSNCYLSISNGICPVKNHTPAIPGDTFSQKPNLQ